MQKRDFKFKMNQLDDANPGFFEGLLAVYNNVDLGNDVIVSGACTRTIRANGSQIPLLWQHQPDQPIGSLKLIDSPDALRVQGQLLMDLPMAQNAYKLLAAKVIKGLSIGYDVVKDTVENDVRYLKELRLWEGSLVTFPMNEQAMVTSIKSLSDVERVLRSVTDLTDADVVRQLKSIDCELKRLLRKDSACECTCEECTAAGNCENCDDLCEVCVNNEDCEGCMEILEEQTLASLKSFATSLKSLVA